MRSGGVLQAIVLAILMMPATVPHPSRALERVIPGDFFEYTMEGSLSEAKDTTSWR